MGQCFGWNGGQSGATTIRTNRRFEYTPKKSWKYKDAHMMSQFQALSMDSEDEERGGDMGRPPLGPFSVGGEGLTSGSEDELYEVDIRNNKKDGKLEFTEEEDDDDDVEDINQPALRTTLTNRGFRPLENQNYDSPELSRPFDQEDKLQLLEHDSLDGVT